MFDAIFSRSVKILKIFAKVQCVLAFVLAAMLYGAVYNALKSVSLFPAVMLGLVVAVAGALLCPRSGSCCGLAVELQQAVFAPSPGGDYIRRKLFAQANV